MFRVGPLRNVFSSIFPRSIWARAKRSPLRQGMNFPHASARFGEPHGHPGDTADDFCIARIRKSANFASRVRIRNCEQVAFTDFAPTADIFAPQLYEIDGTLELILPFNGKYFSLVSVNLYDRTGPDERIHGEVAGTDHPVDGSTKIQLLDQPNRNLTPDFH